MKRSHETIYRVIRKLKAGMTAHEIHENYLENKNKCGRNKIVLTEEEVAYVKKKTKLGWAPDVIVGRNRKSLSCGVKTLYSLFAQGVFDQKSLPLKGKRKPNGYKEKRGKQSFRRTIKDRELEHPNFNGEFGHLEGDTIVGANCKSAVITLVERKSKVIITLKPYGRKAVDIENSISTWLQNLPKNLFKSIIFDCGKEFSNWKEIGNQNDIDIYFADPGTPSQRGFNENSNGLLRRDGLPKQMDFRTVSEEFIAAVADRRNNIPRKSLHYQTPIECFMKCVTVQHCLA